MFSATWRNILENCENLAMNPELGKTYENISENLLGFRAGKHVIFYIKTELDSILIVRILHGQMDLKTRTNE